MSGSPVPQMSRRLAVAGFRQRFDADPEGVVRAPGRVNLIGEHTDYNDGFVLPIAINRWVWLAFRRRTDRRVRLHSVDLEADSDFSLDHLGNPGRDWIDYAKGTAWALIEQGHVLAGFDGVLSSDLPVGAGLSSSAALEMAMARIFAGMGGLAWDALAMAQAGRRAENEWLGVDCGIMDPLISAGARAGHAALIDCRSLEMEPVPWPAGVAVAVLDTSTRRSLAGSAYNQRRAECAAAAAACGVPSLRGVSRARLGARRSAMGEMPFRRALHVLTENERTRRAARALRAGDAGTLGRLMDESHRSLRDDFEVSTPALDAMVESARTAPGCHGARLTGAGFGGCVVALVKSRRITAFTGHAVAAFRARTGLVPGVHVCRPVAGAEVVASKRAGRARAPAY